MSVFDDIKAKADANGDGKLDQNDLSDLEGKIPQNKLAELKNLADQNGDGKVDFGDMQHINLDDTLTKAKDGFGSMFSGK